MFLGPKNSLRSLALRGYNDLTVICIFCGHFTGVKRHGTTKKNTGRTPDQAG
jgi:hypothetical protein